MNEEIKIIDLLNKIANNEEVPKKIRYDGNDYCFCNPCGTYEVIESNELCGKDLYGLLDDLNDKVEIIEEDNNVIGRILTTYDGEIIDYVDGEKHLIKTNRKDRDIYILKINKLIDEINKLKENK